MLAATPGYRVRVLRVVDGATSGVSGVTDGGGVVARVTRRGVRT